jgi:NADH-quinone oxidoreductase subunit J
MVLFVFVIMMLNLGQRSREEERLSLEPKMWIGPSLLAGVLFSELIYLIVYTGNTAVSSAVEITPKQVGIALFGPYAIGVELASMLLLAGLVGAYHLGAGRTGNSSSVTGDKT